jgi:hypothetical protein
MKEINLKGTGMIVSSGVLEHRTTIWKWESHMNDNYFLYKINFSVWNCWQQNFNTNVKLGVILNF